MSWWGHSLPVRRLFIQDIWRVWNTVYCDLYSVTVFHLNKLEYIRLPCNILICLFISYPFCFALNYSWQLLGLNSICEIHIRVVRRKLCVWVWEKNVSIMKELRFKNKLSLCSYRYSAKYSLLQLQLKSLSVLEQQKQYKQK